LDDFYAVMGMATCWPVAFVLLSALLYRWLAGDDHAVAHSIAYAVLAAGGATELVLLGGLVVARRRLRPDAVARECGCPPHQPRLDPRDRARLDRGA